MPLLPFLLSIRLRTIEHGSRTVLLRDRKPGGHGTYPGAAGGQRWFPSPKALSWGTVGASVGKPICQPLCNILSHSQGPDAVQSDASGCHVTTGSVGRLQRARRHPSRAAWSAAQRCNESEKLTMPSPADAAPRPHRATTRQLEVQCKRRQAKNCSRHCLSLRLLDVRGDLVGGSRPLDGPSCRPGNPHGQIPHGQRIPLRCCR